MMGVSLAVNGAWTRPTTKPLETGRLIEEECSGSASVSNTKLMFLRSPRERHLEHCRRAGSRQSERPHPLDKIIKAPARVGEIPSATTHL
jgi:hypothetical protein